MNLYWKNEKTIKLTLTENQARIVGRACEFYARVRVGQFDELSYSFLQGSVNDGYYERKQQADALLLEARKIIFPELQEDDLPYGVGTFEDADLSYDIYQVILHAVGGKTPFRCGELPICEVENKPSR